ncbi:LysR family transcriptional regulator [Bacillus sp. ISL-47]|uniref:LysR family transcriptional regulator n=1 Tax=Bacillus sp. ISL-47 TaxID=2819130 RepID=UPI001BEB56ED|nr:LysR family transcriptional regulator [Bacillus sp. ISL-47]MBT2689847.1 LysR family transcriptional regulator [Bacillus sp. ISL-47]MBT2710224.1 LysR family transcriptional regulator [Pseudomonas sp. ISL-84]
MESSGIQAFLAIVRHGSLTGAASSLFLTQSTLSHRLTQLEEFVGMTLIERGRGIRSLSLTPSGEEFLKIAKQWEELIQETKYLRSQKKQALTIGAVDSIHNFILPPVYKALNSHSNEMNLRLITYIGEELYSLLEQDKIDIAFALLEKPRPDLIIKKFYSEPLVVIRHDFNPEKSHKYINFLDLDPSNELYHEWSPSFQAWYERCREDREFLGIRIDSAGLIFNFMSFPNKWVIVPMSMAKKFIKMEGFSLYWLETPPPDRKYYRIQRKHPRSNTIESLKILDSYLSLLHESSLLVK